MKKDRELKIAAVVSAIVILIFLGLTIRDQIKIRSMEKANYERAFGGEPLSKEDVKGLVSAPEYVSSVAPKSEREIELDKHKTEYKERQAKIRENVTLADYEKICNGEWLMKSVYTTGEISALYQKDGNLLFTLMPIASDTESTGIYEIYCIPLFDESFNNLKNGDTVKIYGDVELTNEKTGAPVIYALVVEPI